MADLPKTIKQWQMTQPTVYNRETKETTPGKLEMVEIPPPYHITSFHNHRLQEEPAL